MIKPIKYRELNIEILLNLAAEKAKNKDTSMFDLVNNEYRRTQEHFAHLTTREGKQFAVNYFNSDKVIHYVGTKPYTLYHLNKLTKIKNYLDVFVLEKAYLMNLIDDNIGRAKQLLIDYLKQ